MVPRYRNNGSITTTKRIYKMEFIVHRMLTIYTLIKKERNSQTHRNVILCHGSTYILVFPKRLYHHHRQGNI